MKHHHPPDVDAIPRWRDQPGAGRSDTDDDEDRAGALVRAALVPGAFPVGLDDRRLAAIGARVRVARRTRPPAWLRPAVVAVLVTASVASVMGYQSGWFAPLRERLRFRAIPAAVPEPVPHQKRSVAAARSPTVPEVGVGESASAFPDSDPPVPPRARVAKSAASPPLVPRADVASAAPPVEAPQPSAASEEIRALEQAVGLLRGKHDAAAALAALDDYIARYPSGVLVREARVARVDALLTLDRDDDALRALEALPLDAHRRSTELQLIRGELRARADCGRAEADFTAVLSRARTAALEERALYGRATCRSALGDAGGAAEDLRRYVDRFPDGAHADWARRWLRNDR